MRRIGGNWRGMRVGVIGRQEGERKERERYGMRIGKRKKIRKNDRKSGGGGKGTKGQTLKYINLLVKVINELE